MSRMQGENRSSKQSYLQCIWMAAGVIDYKLCDRQYECETCPLDAGIRQGSLTPVWKMPLDRLPASGKTRPGAGRREREAELIDFEGYGVVDTLFYHPAHVWARVEDAGRLRIGLDDFAQKLIGRVFAVSLPEEGDAIGPGATSWRVVHAAGETVLTVPVSGVVKQVNRRLPQHPSLINRDPYGQGGAMVVQPDQLVDDLKRLYYGKQVKRWYESETERLHHDLMSLMGESHPELGCTLQDGGFHVEDLFEVMSVDQVANVIDRFLCPGSSSEANAVLGSDRESQE